MFYYECIKRIEFTFSGLIKLYRLKVDVDVVDNFHLRQLFSDFGRMLNCLRIVFIQYLNQITKNTIPRTHYILPCKLKLT